MIMQLFALLDFLVVGGVLLSYFDVGRNIVAFFYLFFFIKTVVFLPNIAGWIDLIALIIFILALFGVFNFVTWIAVIWILQKAIFSLFST